MFQDKTLVCRDCDAEFVFTASEQEFYAEKGLPMTRAVVPSAGLSGNRETSVAATVLANLAKCMKPFVPLAAPPPKCRLNPAVTVPFIAATVTPSGESGINLLIQRQQTPSPS